MAAAEAQYRTTAAGQADEARIESQAAAGRFVKRVMLYGSGAVLLLAACGIVAVVALRQNSVTAQQQVDAPFIATDDTKAVSFDDTTTRGELLEALTNAAQNESLQIGLVGRIAPVVASTTPGAEPDLMSAADFLTLLQPRIPGALLRTIQPTFFFGVHSIGTNEPFLIFNVDNYEQGYSGMLAWEQTMKDDLYPLFNYHPNDRITGVSTATSSATTTPTDAFVDQIIVNHDARAQQTPLGEATLLWMFLDRNTILIATNPSTVNEVITRLKNAPVSAQVQ